jgi:hypothetical protein
VLRATSTPGATKGPLSYLSIPDTLSSYPDAPVIGVMPVEFLADPRILRIGGSEADPLGTAVRCRRLAAREIELVLDFGSESCSLLLGTDGQATSLQGTGMFVDDQGEVEPLDDFLSEHPPALFFGDGTLVYGAYAINPPSDPLPLPLETRDPWDWEQTEIQVEFGSPPTQPNSVAAFTISRLEEEADTVIQDHLAYELADFICVRAEGEQVSIDVVHCKAAGGNPSCRVTDLEELLAQAMRSIYFATAGPRIWVELRRRFAERASTKVIKGDEAALDAQFKAWAETEPLINWRLTVVQPGVADNQLDGWPEGNALFSAAYDSCKAQGIEFRLIDSSS